MFKLTLNGILQNLEPRKCRPKSFGEVHDNFNWIECASKKNPDSNYYFNVRSHCRTWQRPVPENIELPFFNPHSVAQQTSDNENESSPPVSELDDTPDQDDEENEEIEKQHQAEKRFFETASKLFYHGSRNSRRTRRILEDIQEDSELYQAIPISDFLEVEYISEDSAKRLRSPSSSSESGEESSAESTKESSTSSCHCSCCDVKNSSDDKSRSCGSSTSYQSLSSTFSAPRLKQITFSDLMTEPRQKVRRRRKRCKIDPSNERKVRLTPDKIICDMYGIRTISYDPIFEYINPTLPVDVQPACLTDSSIGSPDHSEEVQNNTNSFFDLPLHIRDPVLSEVSSGSETAEPFEGPDNRLKEVTPSKSIWRPWTEQKKSYADILGGKVLCIKLQRIDLDKDYFAAKNKNTIKASEIKKSKENNQECLSENSGENGEREEEFAETSSERENSEVEGYRRRLRASTNSRRNAKIYLEPDTEDDDYEMYFRSVQKATNRRKTSKFKSKGLSETEEKSSEVQKRIESNQTSKGNIEQEESFVEASTERKDSEKSSNSSGKDSNDVETTDSEIDRRSLQKSKNRRTMFMLGLLSTEEELSEIEEMVEKHKFSKGNNEQGESFVEPNMERGDFENSSVSSGEDSKDASDGCSKDAEKKDFEIDRRPLQKSKNRKTMFMLGLLSTDEELSEIEELVQRNKTSKENFEQEESFGQPNMERKAFERRNSTGEDSKDSDECSTDYQVFSATEEEENFVEATMERDYSERGDNSSEDSKTVDGSSRDGSDENSTDESEHEYQDESDDKSRFGWVIVNSQTNKMRLKKVVVNSSSSENEKVNSITDFEEVFKYKPEAQESAKVQAREVTEELKDLRTDSETNSVSREKIYDSKLDFEEEIKDKEEDQASVKVQECEATGEEVDDLRVEFQTNSRSSEKEKINSMLDFEEEFKEKPKVQEEPIKKVRETEDIGEKVEDLRFDSQTICGSLVNGKADDFEEKMKEKREAQESVKENEVADEEIEDLRVECRTNSRSSENGKINSMICYEEEFKEKPEAQEAANIRENEFAEEKIGETNDLRKDFEDRENEFSEEKIKDLIVVTENNSGSLEKEEINNSQMGFEKETPEAQESVQENEVTDEEMADLRVESQTNSEFSEDEKTNNSEMDFEEELKEKQEAQSANKARENEFPGERIEALIFVSENNYESSEKEVINFEKEKPEAQKSVHEDEDTDEEMDDLRVESQTSSGSSENEKVNNLETDIEEEFSEEEIENLKAISQTNSGSPANEKTNDLRNDFEDQEKSEANRARENEFAEIKIDDLIFVSENTSRYPENEKINNSRMNFEEERKEKQEANKTRENEFVKENIDLILVSEKNSGSPEKEETNISQLDFERERPEVQKLGQENKVTDKEMEDLKALSQTNSGSPANEKTNDLRKDFEEDQEKPEANRPREKEFAEKKGEINNSKMDFEKERPEALESVQENEVTDEEMEDLRVEFEINSRFSENEKINLKMDFEGEFKENPETQEANKVRENEVAEGKIEDLIFVSQNDSRSPEHEKINHSKMNAGEEMKEKQIAQEPANKSRENEFAEGKVEDLMIDFERKEAETSLETKDSDTEILSEDLTSTGNSLESLNCISTPGEFKLRKKSNSCESLTSCLSTETYFSDSEDKKEGKEMQNLEKPMELDEEEELLQNEDQLEETEISMDIDEEFLLMDLDEDLPLIEKENSLGEKGIDPFGKEMKSSEENDIFGIGNEEKNKPELSGIEKGNSPELVLIDSEDEEESPLIETGNKERLSGTEKEDKNMEVDEEFSETDSCSTVLGSKSTSEDDEETTDVDEGRILSETETVVGDGALERWSSDESNHDSDTTEICFDLDYD